MKVSTQRTNLDCSNFQMQYFIKYIQYFIFKSSITQSLIANEKSVVVISNKYKRWLLLLLNIKINANIFVTLMLTI